MTALAVAAIAGLALSAAAAAPGSGFSRLSGIRSLIATLALAGSVTALGVRAARAGRLVRERSTQDRDLMAAMEHAVEGMARLDTRGRYVEANAAYASMPGCAAASLIGSDWEETIHPDDRPLAQNARAAMIATGKGTAEVRSIDGDGQVAYKQVTLIRIKDHKGGYSGCWCFTRNITEQMLAQVRLRESEKRFRLFVQGVQDYAIFVLDRDGIITNWNVGAERIKGYAAEDILGEHFSRLYSPEDVEAHKPEQVLEAATANGRCEDEGWRVRKDGSKIWVQEVTAALRDESGNLYGFAKVTRDLTERRESEFKLLESARGYDHTSRQLEFLKFALDQHAIVAITDARGRITYVNQKFCDISQYSREELLGQDHRIVNSGHHSKAFFRDMYATISAGSVWRGEICNRAKDGSLYWVDTTIVPAKDDKGRIINYAAIRTDTTEKMGTQAAITRAYELLADRNNKLSALSDRAHSFVDDVSHEFRTPLAVIKEFVSIIADGLAGPVSKEQVEYLAILGNAVLDLNHMVEDFLDSSKLRAGRLRVDRQGHEIVRIFDGVRPLIAQKAAQRSIEFKERIEAGLPRVFADEEKVRRIIMNIAINAIKFSKNGDEVELWARRCEEGGVEIGVTDHGPGLAPQDLERLFERFRQFESSPSPGIKGFGLGLNIARQLVWLNLGVMRVASQPGQGATFSFTLPPNEPAAVVAAFFGRLAECKDPVPSMVLLEVVSQGPDIQDEVAAFLSATTRPSDLLLRDAHSGNALLLGPTGSAEGWIERIRQAHTTAVPGAEDLRIDVVGEWRSLDRMERAQSATIERVTKELAHA